MREWPDDVEYIARDWSDYVSVLWSDGVAVALEKATGRWFRLPHPDCPIVIIRPLELVMPATAEKPE